MDDKDDSPWKRVGEWREYHTNDIAEMKMLNFVYGLGTGGLLSGIAFWVYFVI